MGFESFPPPPLAYFDWPGPPIPLPEGVVPHLPKLEPLIELLVRGARTGEAGHYRDFRAAILDGRKKGAMIGGWLLDLLVATASQRAYDGDATGAVDLLLVLDRIGADRATSGTMIDRAIIGGEVRIRAAEALAALAGADLLSPRALDRVEAWARANLSPPEPDWGEFQADELAAQVDLLRAVDGEEKLFAGAGELGGRWYDRMLFGFLEPSRGEALDAWRMLREVTDRIRANWPNGGLAAFANARAELTRVAAGEDMVTSLSLGWLANQLGIVALYRDRLRLSRERILLNVAFVRYRRANGGDPPSVEAIRPPEVRARPADGPWVIRTEEATGREWVDVEEEKSGVDPETMRRLLRW